MAKKQDGSDFIPGLVIGFCLCLVALFLGLLTGSIAKHFSDNPQRTLSEADIFRQTDVCNRAGRLTGSNYDNEGNITKIWCGLPPFEDKRWK